MIKKQSSNKSASGLLAEVLKIMPNLYHIRKIRQIFSPIFLLFLAIQFLGNQAIAQLDTEFWFAPPELTASTTESSRRDQPIQLVISTLEKPADIQILQPADLTFIPITFNLAANSTKIVDLSAFKDRLESKPENKVLKTGLYIKSTNSISAYYEIRSPNNTDIFSLKGSNALGKLFYTPFQTNWDNALANGGNAYNPVTFASFDIIATDDSTLVTVTPKKEIIGHPAGIPFTFRLDRGQVYSCRAIDRFGANHPAGSKIESTKEIAVTMKDDMLQFAPPVPGADIAGDQLIPVDYLGTSYVLVKGGLNNNQDRCYILAVEDNTIIRVDGNPIPLDTLNEGEQHELRMINSSYFLSSNKKVAVLHISGLADQVAGAVIPALSCTGTNQIGFTRTNSATFIVNVITKNSAKNNFTLNNDPNLVPGSAFQPILGSNGWVFARITFSTSQIPAGTTLLLKNSGDELFHVGVTNYAAGVGSNYGYFSNFSRLNLGTNKNLCVGDTAVLDAGPAKTSYQWSTGATTRTIETIEPGKYWVNTLSGTQCPKTDTVTVRFYEPFFTLGPDDTICIGSNRLITPSGVFTYTWQDGSTQPVYTATQAGIYWAQVADFQGCTTRDSIVISEFPRPQTPLASIGDTVCKGGLVSLTMGNVANATYAWLDPDSTVISGKSILINTNTQPEGAYKAFIKINGCESFFDTSFVGIVQPPATDLGKDTVLCSVGGSYLLDPGAHQDGFLYQWSNSTSDSVLTVTQSGKYKVTVSSPFGCSAIDSVNVTFQQGPGKPTILPSIFFCANQTASFGVAPQTGFTYNWSGPNGFTSSGASVTISNAQLNQSGIYTVTAFQNGCPGIPADTTITINESPIVNLGKDSASCAAFGLVLDPVANGAGLSYLWSNGSTDSTLSVSSAGQYFVSVTNGTCTSKDTIQVTFGAGPSVVTPTGLRNYCAGESATFGVVDVAGETYSWTGPNGFTFNGAVISLPGVQQIQAGTYTVTPSLPGCPGTPVPFQLIVRPSPVINPMADTSICPGSTVELDPVLNGGDETFYTWSNGLADSSITVSSAGTYRVTAFLGLCQAKDTVVVSLKPGPSAVTSNGITQYCPGDTARFGVNPKTNEVYNWTGPNGFTFTGTNVEIPGLASGQFGTYTVTAVLGTCSGIPADVIISQNATPVLSLVEDTTICGGNTVVIDPVSFGNGYTYNWSNGTTDSTLTVNLPGKYLVTVSNGTCSSTDSVTVSAGQIPDAVSIAGQNSYCQGDNAGLNVTPQTGVIYTWSGPNGFSAVSNSISIANIQTNQAGFYSVISTLNGCNGPSDTIQISVGSTPVIELGSDQTLCSVPSIVLDPTPNSQGFTFSWNNGSIDSSITVSTSGTYKVTVTDGTCSSQDSVQLTFGTSPGPLSITGTSTLCSGETLSLQVASQTGVTISWTGPNGFTSSGNSIALNNIQPNQAGDYIVNSENNGCVGTGDTVSVSIGQTPVIELGPNTSLCNGSSIILDPVLHSVGLTYLWSNGSTDSSLTVSTIGQYSVIVTSGVSCIAKDTIQVTAGTPPPTVTVLGDTLNCTGNSAVLFAPAQTNVTYNWTGPNGFTASTDTIRILNLTTANAGQYTVTPKLGDCIGIPTTVNLYVGVKPVLELGSDQTLCSVPSIVLDPMPNSAGFTFSWNNGSTDSSLTVSTSGTYKVIVSDGGCSAQDSVQLTFGTTPNPLSITGISTICAGETLSLQVSAQTDVTISWTGPNGFTSSGNSISLNNIQVNQAGEYIVNSTNNGCSGTGDTISVSIGQTPQIELGPAQSLCNGSSIVLDPVQHSAGFTFLWSNGSTDSTLTVSSTGQYSVIVSGGGACTAKDTIQVNAGTPPAAVTVFGDTINCTGSSAVLFAPAQTNVTYTWTGPNGFTASTDTIRILNLTTANAGQYIVTPQLGNCIGIPTAVNLQVGIGPIVYLGIDDTICGNTLVTLDPTNGLDGFSYEWNVGSTDSSISINQSGQYSVTVRYLGCVRSDTVNLTFSPLPVPVTIEGDAAKCAGDSILLTLQGTQSGTNYNWSGPGGFTSSGLNVTIPAITLSNAGQYQVTPNLDGCSGTATSIDIVVNARPFAELGLNLQSCEGTSFTLDPNPASAGLTFLWNTGSTDTSIIVNQTGTYSVIVSNGTICTTKDTIDVTLNPYPAAPTFTGDTVYCAGETGSFGTNPVTGATVNWTGPNGFTSSGETINIISAVASQTGFYSATLNAGGCLGLADSIFVRVSPFPTVNLGPDTSFCGNESYTLVAGNGTLENSYLWNTGALTSTLSVGVTGIFYVTVSNGALCSASDTVSVIFKTSPDSIEVIQGSVTACENSTVTFEVQVEPIAQTFWTGPNGFTATGSSITVPANGLSAGTYTVVNRFDGCSGISKNLELTTKPIPTILVTYDSLVCTGTKKPATAVATPGSSIFWSNNFSGPSSEFGIGTHWAEATLNGCAIRDTFRIRNSGPIANFVTNPDSNLVVYEAVQFIDKSVAGASPISFWEWKLGNSQIRNDQNTSYTYSTDGDFDIQLIVKDNLGCSDTLVKTITLITPRGWFIPNLFTPNGDGDNDLFEVGDMDKYPGTKVTVFNRWGHEEYSSKDYKNNWDGGSLVNGVYFYNIERADGQSFTGYVNLRR